MTAVLINFLTLGTLLGAAAASIVTLVAQWRPRVAWIAGMTLFPIVALLPVKLTGGADAIWLPSTDGRVEMWTTAIWLLVTSVLVLREVLSVRATPRDGPATYGLLRPRIVIPPALAHDARVLRHELEHVAWRDPLWNFVRRVVRAIGWCHPGLWLLDRAIRQAAELAADAGAIAGADSRARIAYAETLLAAARATSGASLGDRGKALEERLRAIFGTRRRIAGRVVVLLLTLAAFIAVPRVAAPDGGERIVIVHVR